MQHWHLLGVALIICSTVLSGCATTAKPQAGTERLLTTSSRVEIAPEPGLTDLQRRYKAEQKAASQAFRQLAGLLYRQTTQSGTVVAEQVLQDETYRVYLDTYLREAKPTRTHDNHFVSVALELPVNQRFKACMDDRQAVARCLAEEQKSAFSRIGYRQALHKQVNLDCILADCSGQLSVAGFSQENSVVDKALLSAGLYDLQWLVNASANIAFRYFLLAEFPPTH